MALVMTFGEGESQGLCEDSLKLRDVSYGRPQKKIAKKAEREILLKLIPVNNVIMCKLIF